MSREYVTIRLKKDAYELLARRKREGESFSEVVERLAGERPITDLAGIFSDGEVAEIRDARDGYE